MGLGDGEIQTVGFPKLQEVVYKTLLQTSPAKVLCSQDSVTKSPALQNGPVCNSRNNTLQRSPQPKHRRHQLATLCNPMQHTATTYCNNTLQHAPQPNHQRHQRCMSLRHTATTHCNNPLQQHTATLTAAKTPAISALMPPCSKHSHSTIPTPKYGIPL